MSSLMVMSENPLPIDLSAILPTRYLSQDQFYEFCRTNPDLRVERTASGEVFVMPPAFSDTGNRNMRISAQVFNWAEAQGNGEVFDSSAGFTLPNGAMRSPDTAWIQADRWNALSPHEKSSFAPIVPDVVIELRSSSDSLSQLQNKMAEYIENGVCLGLLIDRDNRQVYLYRPHGIEILDHPDAVNCMPEMQDFSLKMTKIWCE